MERSPEFEQPPEKPSFALHLPPRQLKDPLSTSPTTQFRHRRPDRFHAREKFHRLWYLDIWVHLFSLLVDQAVPEVRIVLADNRIILRLFGPLSSKQHLHNLGHLYEL